jgi:hypothetical protein
LRGEVKQAHEVQFVTQGDFTICILRVVFENYHEESYSLGVAKRNTGDKYLMELAEYMEALDEEWKASADYIKRKYAGDPPRPPHAQRLAYSRAIDNLNKGECS